MLQHALAGVSRGAKAMSIMLSRCLPRPGGLDVTAGCRRPAVPSMHGMCCCDLACRQQGMAAYSNWALSAARPMSTSTRKLVVQAATGQPVSAAVAARAAVDPNSLRVVDTELHVEAERSYLAVRDRIVGLDPVSIPAVSCDTESLIACASISLVVTRGSAVSRSMPCLSSWGALCRTCGTA